jgi:hypothetical protein
MEALEEAVTMSPKIKAEVNHSDLPKLSFTGKLYDILDKNKWNIDKQVGLEMEKKRLAQIKSAFGIPGHELILAHAGQTLSAENFIGGVIKGAAKDLGEQTVGYRNQEDPPGLVFGRYSLFSRSWRVPYIAFPKMKIKATFNHGVELSSGPVKYKNAIGNKHVKPMLLEIQELVARMYGKD